MTRPEELTKNERLVWSTGAGTDVWEMFMAAKKGDIETAAQLLDKDPSLVRGAFQYRLPLTFAVQENQLAMAAFLISKGASPVNSGTNDNLPTMAADRGYTQMEKLLNEAVAGPGNDFSAGEAIAEAIRSRGLEAVKTLLDNSPQLLHAADKHSNQPIHWAVMTRQPEMIDELLQRGADINAKRKDGAAPVQLVNGDYNFRGWMKDFPIPPLEILAHLRAKGAYIDICTAAAIGDIDRVRLLLDEDPSLANRVSDYVTYYIGSGAPIKNAAARGHIDIVKLLLERGADPNLPEEGIAPRGHALHSAVCSGHIEIVRLLLNHGAYPNVDIESSADTLCAAIARDNKPIIELLCSHGAASAVHLLAYYGDIRTAAAVFAANPSLANDPYALECATTEGHEAFVRLMLLHQPKLAERIAVGVQVQGPDRPIKTRTIAELLFKHGMDANMQNWLGVRPLHRFAQRGDIENALIFLEHGADINARDEDICSTPLAWAAKYGRLEMVELLLKHGAKTNLPDDAAWTTPLAWAQRRGYEQIIGLLKQHNAA